jgi:hypothetical protein
MPDTGPNKRQTGSGALPRKVTALGQEAITRMQRVAAAGLSGRDGCTSAGDARQRPSGHTQ